MIEQAIYGTEGPGGYHFLARSIGFLDEWLEKAERLCTGFGERPPGIAVPGCVFAQPFANRRVAVVQVADLGLDNTGRPGALGFRLLLLPLSLYHAIGGDPFLVADTFPPSWRERGELPTLEWPGPFHPLERTVAQVRKVLDVPNSATLLGGVQVLLDGGRLVFERNNPDPHIVRSLWALLPTSTRSELWPASFAFSNRHHFHVIVLPRASGPDFEEYAHEEQAGDYPEGRYELALQIAAEHGRQDDLDTLFARRSRSQMMHLTLMLLAAFILVPLFGLLLSPNAGVPPPDKPAPTTPPAPTLPRADECPPLDRVEREGLVRILTQIDEYLGLKPPENSSSGALLLALESLDTRLGTAVERQIAERRGRAALLADTLALPAAGNPLVTGLAIAFGPTGQLRDFGPLQRGVRVLLWKQSVPDASDLKLNTVELLERLEQKMNAGKP